MQQPQAFSRITSRLKYFMSAILVIAACICFWFFRDNTIRFLTVASGWPLVGIVVVSLIGFLVDVERNRFYFLQLRFPVDFKGFYHIIMASYLFGQGIYSKLGAPIRLFLLKKMYSVDYSLSLSVFLADTVLGYIIIGLGGLAGFYRFYPGVSNRNATLVIIGLVALFALMMIIKLRLSSTRADKEPLTTSIWNNLRACLDMLSAKVLFVGGGGIFVYFFLGAIRLQIELSCFNFNIDLTTLLYIECLAYLASILSLIPAGIGVREVSQTLLFMQVGVPQDVAITLSLIDRFFVTGLSVLTGFISLGILGHRSESNFGETGKTKQKLNQNSMNASD